MIWRLFLAFFATAVFSVGTARATILQTYTDSASFLLAFPVPNADTLTFGPTGPGPFADLTGAAVSVGSGFITIAASTGNLFGASTILSTEIDQATLVLTFAQPITAVGLSTLITDEFFAAIGGDVLIEAVGSGMEGLTVTDAGEAFIGLRSDVAFSTLRISVNSFDQNASSAAFASLSDTVYGARAASVSVPAPGGVALLLPMLALGLARRASRRPREPT